MSHMKPVAARLLVPAFVAALVVAGCGGSSTPPAGQQAAETPPPPAAPPVAETAPAPAPAPEAATAEQDKAAELAAKEQELKAREQELALKEKEAQLKQREAQLAAKEAAAKKAAAKPVATAPAPKPVAVAPVAAKTVPPLPPQPLVVPAGTTLAAELVAPVSTKTARVGDRVQARLTTDVMVGGQRAIAAGAMLSGAVTQRVSGSHEIGATPVLGITFDTLSVDAQHTVPVSARFAMTGKSETGQDIAKIAGGAIAGAIIGHQVSKDKGTIVGGVLGAAAGTAAAKNTGTDVELAAGTVLSVALDNAVEVRR